MTNFKRMLGISLMLIVLVSCNENLSQKAEKIHGQIVSIDTHTDTPLNFLDPQFDVGKWNDFQQTRTRVDFPRMRAGRLDGIFMAVLLAREKELRKEMIEQKARLWRFLMHCTKKLQCIRIRLRLHCILTTFTV